MKIYQEITNVILNSDKRVLTVKNVRNSFEQQTDIYIEKRALTNYIWRAFRRLEKDKKIKLIKNTSPGEYKKK